MRHSTWLFHILKKSVEGLICPEAKYVNVAGFGAKLQAGWNRSKKSSQSMKYTAGLIKWNLLHLM